ncbi:cobalamin biosynthesis protein CbiX [Actinoplanes sp. NBC_00393]|uniref:sirohydrochlorin chelatase n=1 Tax=Actinoplanes sp. NBC_00393 TaxID=2975953 RepID=UPI002E1F2E68
MRPARLTPRGRDGLSGRPAVVLVAHGSRDPRAAVATESLARAVQVARPEWDVQASYLDHDGPRPLDILASLGTRRAVLVPLLLTAAYHGRVDLPAVVRAAESLPVSVTATDVLGPASPLLLAAVSRRLDAACRRLPETPLNADRGLSRLKGVSLEASRPPSGHVPLDEPLRMAGGDRGCSSSAGLDAVVLAAAGTRNAAARETVAAAAAALGARLGLPAAVGYASGPGGTAGEAVAALQGAGARRVGMAAYFLAPGLLYDVAVRSATQAGAVAIAEPLGAAPELVQLVIARAESNLDTPLAAAA